MTLYINNKANSPFGLKSISFINLKTNKNLKIKGLSPLYLSGKANKSLSKKESFYQYLFIQQIFSNYSGNGGSFEGVNYTPQMEIFTKKINLLNKNNPTLIKGFLQDKIFITYRKSFLCYWLLPFLGLVSSFPTLFKSSVMFPQDHSRFLAGNEINPPDLSFNINNPIIANNSESLINNLYGLGSNNLLNMSTTLKPMEQEYSLLLYSKDNSTQSANSVNNNAKLYEYCLNSIFKDLLIQDKINKKRYLNSSQSLLLSVLNLNNYNPTLNLRFSDYNFTILNRNIKLRSKFKWYWFNLFLNKHTQGYSNSQQAYKNSSSFFQPNSVWFGKSPLSIFPNKISDPITLSESKNSILKTIADAKSTDLRKTESIDMNNNFLFLDSILQSTLSLKEKNSLSCFCFLSELKNNKENQINQNNTILKQKLNNQISQNQLKLEVFSTESSKNNYSDSFEPKKDLGKYLGEKANTSNENYLIGILNNDMRKKSLVKKGVSKIPGLKFSNNSFLYGFRDKKSLASSAVSGAVFEKKHQRNYQNFLLFVKNKKMTPYKSFKKANYLMDRLKMNSRIAFLSPYIRTVFSGKNGFSFNSEDNTAFKKELGHSLDFLLAKNLNINSESLNLCLDFLPAKNLNKTTHLRTKIINSFNNVLVKQTEWAWHENPQVLEKTILFLLKNKNSSARGAELSIDPSLVFSVPQKNSNIESDLSLSKEVNQFKNKSLGSSFFNSFELKKSAPYENSKIIKLEESTILYKSIFEGLKENISQIIDSKANRINAYPYNINTLEEFKTNKISMSAWQSKYGQETGIHELGLVPSNVNKFDEPILQELYNEKLESLKPNFSVYLSSEEKKNALETFVKNKNELIFPKKFNRIASSANVLTLSIRGGNLALFKDENFSVSTFVKGSFAPFFTNTYLANSPFNFSFFDFWSKKLHKNNPTLTIEELNKLNNKTISLKEIDKQPVLIKKETFLNKENLFDFIRPDGEKQKSVHLQGKNKTRKSLNKNSFLFLSKYLNLMTNNIKTILSPYKLRLTYLSEINLFQSKFDSNNSGTAFINKNQYQLEKEISLSRLAFFNKKKLSNLSLVKERSVDKNSSLKLEKKIKSNEKIFLSYLSKSKKSAILSSSGKGNKKFVTSSLVTLPKESSKRIKWLRSLKFKSKINLSKLNLQNSSFTWNTTVDRINKNNIPDFLFSTAKNVNSACYGRKEAHKAKILLKNRLFINKEIDFIKSNNFKNYMAMLVRNKKEKQEPVSLFANESFANHTISSENIRTLLINSRLKKQQLKIKRRLKKMKKETRRRKKRKIFYPRPTWIVFSMYKKFLDSRYSSLNTSLNVSSASAVLNLKNQSSKPILEKIKGIKRNDKLNKTIKLESLFFPKNKQEKYEFWLSKKRYKHDFATQTPFAWHQSLNNTKDFYKISRTVFSDLKRVLMKSNWLRSYLNPYLEKVKNIYKEMHPEGGKKMSIYENLRSFILFIYSPAGGPFFTINNGEFFKSTFLAELKKQSQAFPMYINIKNSIFEGQNNSFRRETNKKDFENFKVQHSINLLEYNRLVYQRIQRIILNIRENLNLNGQIKNRSKKLGKNIRALIKRDYIKRDDTGANQNTTLWSKIIKNNLLKFGLAINYNGYDQSVPYNYLIQPSSKNNLYWALNKSSMLTQTNFHTSYTKKLWETYKIREISKSNKTKKLIFNLMMKTEVAQPTNSVDITLINLLQRSTRNIKYITSLSHMADQIGIIQNSLDPNQSTTPLMELLELKEPLTLPAKTYTIKSEQKLINIENKLKLLGVYSQKQQRHYKNTYFRSVEEQLLKMRACSIGYSITEPRLYKLNYSNSNYFGTKLYYSATDSYWWSSFKIGPALNRFVIKSQNNLNKQENAERGIKKQISFLSPVTLSSFLFHFCALISFISLGGVKTLIKFYYILISKISKLSYFAEGLVRFIPKNEFNAAKKVNFLFAPYNTKKESFDQNSLIKKEINKKTNRISLSKVAFFKYLTARRTKTHLSLIEYKRTNFALNAKVNDKNKRAKKSKMKTIAKANPNQNIFSWLEIKEIKNAFANATRLDSKAPLLAKSFFYINSKKYKNGSAILYKNKNNKFLAFIENKNMPLKEAPKKAQKNSHKKLNIKEFHLIVKDLLEFGLFVCLFLWAKKENKYDVKANLNSLNSLDYLLANNLNREQQPTIEKSNTYLNKKSLTNVAALTRKLSIFLSLVHKISFYNYLLLLKSVDVLAVPASFIYKFFEKPGEYVVENIAYSFLVEWSADLIATIPDTVDTHVNIYFSKINTRVISPLIFINMDLALLNLKTPLNINEAPFLLSLSNSILKGLLNSSLLLFIQQLCEPDLDYINRYKKGIIFWDIWGEYLKKVAEENSINIYELTTDKEEQVKLLSKYEEAIAASEKGYLNNEYFQNNLLNTNFYSKYSLYSLNSIFSSSFLRRDAIFNRVENGNNELANRVSLNDSKMNLSGYGYRNLIHFSSVLPSHQNKTLNKALNSKIIPNYSFSNKTDNQNMAEYIHKGKQEQGKTYANYYGWSVSQFLSYQGKSTDLFIDLHPPKTFSTSAAFLQLRLFQQPIGSIVCQIFSGIFYKQISKNILVVGSSGLEKSLLIQAIAGETELKIITDNATRYAMVYQGVAVGIKLLRDVFEALSLHTPCIFLMEDIHAIGERRPFLIDHPTDSNAAESTYNKNQSMQVPLLSASREGLYKNNKHLVSHYKKPYKSGKLLATNHFSFTFLFGDIFTKNRNSEIRPSGIPLPIQVIKKENSAKQSPLASQSKYKSLKKSASKTANLAINQVDKLNNNSYSSSLLIKSAKDELLAPPASSPFNVLILKEAAKLKHKNLVKEMPWFGLPGEQFSLVSKYNYSIRVKVALLADLVLSNLSVKLDMITDLLVIIDSVKGNRGFVVFATTHVPYILDPALRRPGRFDETISLPLIPALYSRWVNYRYNIQYLTTSLFKKYSIPLNSTFNKGTTLDLTKYTVINSPTLNAEHTMDRLINHIYIKASTLNNALYQNTRSSSKRDSLKLTNFSSSAKTNNLNTKQARMREANNSKKSNYANKNNPIVRTQTLSTLAKQTEFVNHLRRSFTNFKQIRGANASVYTAKQTEFAWLKTLQNNTESKINAKSKLSYINKISNKQILQLKSKRYAYACKSIISLMLFVSNFSNKVQASPHTGSLALGKFFLRWPSMLREIDNVALHDYSGYLSLFGYPLMLKIILMNLIGGKLGESFANSSNFKRNEQSLTEGTTNENKSSLVPFVFFGKQKTQTINNAFLFNFDFLDKLGSSLLLSYAEKRQFSTFNKNLLIIKLLSFNNKYSLMEAPSPPISNILLPAKRYENYQRTLNNQLATLINQNNFNASVSDKIQLQKQQRLLKRLYKYPIKEFFRSERVERTNIMSNFSNFNAAGILFLEKTNLASINKLSSVNWCYKNILYNRHKTYLTNQWWTGQLGEHNTETTFLSDIDWRYTFVQSIGDINIDFPDSEQFYNPRNRRWILSHGDWNYWFNIQAELKDIYSHYVYDCFTKAYNYLNQNREIVDFYTEILHQTPLTTELKERDLLNLYKRF